MNSSSPATDGNRALSSAADPAPRPFVTPPTTIQWADLRARLRATRWPASTAGTGWSLGASLSYMRELVEYWAEEYDWPNHEHALTQVPRFHTEIGGASIHYAHIKARTAGGRPSMPLLLAHGWPDSFWRYTKVIPLLTDPGAHGADPSDAFDVVVPDMPGFGYSMQPTGTPLNSIAVADLWAQLMTDLGYSRFGAAGGDIGSGVCRYLSLNHPDRVTALHRLDAGMPAGAADGHLTNEERTWLTAVTSWTNTEGAYAAMHRTKPDTAAFGLNDSPSGLAAWIVEKFRSWSDCNGDIEGSFTKDEILTNVTIYWLTGTIGSSMSIYHANAHIPLNQHTRRVNVPSGFSLFPADILTPPEAWLHRTANTVWISHPPRGGHFAPFEEPDIYADELRNFFRPYRPLST
ncbi:epoxide hydrolase family protein [Mycobacterium sp. SMC-18]|uniref:epoxide hydrolase family protein n=1 Tax=Mycobacterium TaxID=1763 RepID=UPI000CDD55B5|nr:epoxide hydrolase family protein [Mycobacterium kansasii]POX75453.1 multidrug MFS transporter [Mycobacterium kansasii]POY13680.1 multidrug MFS transporter [Mycobacterium kansasii]